MALRIHPEMCLHPVATPEQLARNETANRKIGLPDIAGLKVPRSERLAVVGGGHSINMRKHALRNWDGDVWAINHAAIWCAQNKIKCAMFTVDPSLEFDGAGLGKHVRRAILATCCNPGLFGMLQHADVTVFDLKPEETGPGSVGTVGAIATRIGYKSITYFGCEGSFPAGAQHHAYAENEGAEILVSCGENKFLTEPSFLFTAVAVANLIRQVPSMLSERSGGLLAALIKNTDYDLIGLSPQIASEHAPPELVKGYCDFIARRA